MTENPLTFIGEKGVVRDKSHFFLAPQRKAGFDYDPLGIFWPLMVLGVVGGSGIYAFVKYRDQFSL